MCATLRYLWFISLFLILVFESFALTFSLYRLCDRGDAWDLPGSNSICSASATACLPLPAPRQQLSVFPSLSAHCEPAVLCWTGARPSSPLSLGRLSTPIPRGSLFSLSPPNLTCPLVNFPGQTTRSGLARPPLFSASLQD
ncbi:hypothetical protein HOY82DRAFT_120807 [Tuber indicum]|nr:hypothetical protein HOY82DRAFT_120807 [Tuber indicum]